MVRKRPEVVTGINDDANPGESDRGDGSDLDSVAESIGRIEQPAIPGIADIAGTSDATAITRRGRPRGGTNKRSHAGKKTPPPVINAAIVSLVVDLHGFAARALAPELAIEADEAEKLLKASSDVADLYGYKPSDKVTAWLALAGTLGMVYGTRVVAIRVRLDSERKEIRETKPDIPQEAVVYPFIPPPQ